MGSDSRYPGHTAQAHSFGRFAGAWMSSAGSVPFMGSSQTAEAQRVRSLAQEATVTASRMCSVGWRACRTEGMVAAVDGTAARK